MSARITSFIVLFTFVFISCKKGNEDPFLSLASRKSRISGDWKMVEYNYEEEAYGSSIFVVNDTTKTTGIGDEFSIVTIRESSSLITTTTQTLDEYSYKINRDGTWSAIQEFDLEITFDAPDYIETRTSHVRFDSFGSWIFGRKEKDVYKNKERVMLSIHRTVQTSDSTHVTKVYDDPLIPTEASSWAPSLYEDNYEADTEMLIYDIVMLKSKKMIWEWVQGTTATSTSISGGVTYVWSNTLNKIQRIVFQIK